MARSRARAVRVLLSAGALVLATAWPTGAAAPVPAGERADGAQALPGLLEQLAVAVGAPPDLRQVPGQVAAGHGDRAMAALQPYLAPDGTAAGRVRAVAHLLAAYAAYRQGDHLQVPFHLRQAVTLWPDAAGVRVAAAGLYELLGRPLEGLAVLEVLQTRAAARVEVAAHLGRLYLRAGRPADARRVLEAHPSLATDPISRYHLALAYQQLGDEQAAAQAYQAALEVQSDLAPALNNLGVLAYRQGRLASAASYFRQASRAEPAHPLYRGNLGAVLRAMGELEQAERELEQSIRLGGGGPALWLELGFVRLARGAYAAAGVAFRQAQALSPRHPEAWWGLGLSHAGLGELDAAADALERALEQEPGFWRAYPALAGVRRQQGRWEEARQLLERAVRLAPAVSSLRLQLAEIYLAEGRPGPAEEQLRTAVALGGERPELLYALGRAQLMAGRPQEALSALQQAARREPAGPRRSQIHYAAALAHELLGQQGLAVERLRQAVQDDPDSFDAHLRLGQFLLAQGRRQEAEAFLRRAVQLRPDSSDARDALQQATGAVSGG